MSQDQPKTFGPYSPVRQAGDLYFTAGQIGADHATKTASPDVTEQTEKVLENLKAVLASVGLDLPDVVKATMYLTDMDDFAVVNEVYLRHFPEPRPARTTVAVRELPRLANHPLKIEIEAIAARKTTND